MMGTTAINGVHLCDTCQNRGGHHAVWQDLPFTLGPFHIAGQTIKGRYTRCDLVSYDLVVLYGIESSSILYDMYATKSYCV